jgi:DNA-binding GntR family transcriptional regulator
MPIAQRKMEVVYDQLKAQFLAGKFRFGQRLEVNELGEAMGTSRQPVLEALKRLQDDGLVEVTPQVGSHVIVPSPDAVVDFFRVFAVLEALATTMAAERHTDVDLVALSPTTDLVLTALDGDDFNLSIYLAANRRFHETIHSLARSEEAADAARRYWERSDFLIASMNLSQMRETLTRSVEEHRAIFEAIKAGDGSRAGELATVHVEGFADPIRQSLIEELKTMDLTAFSGQRDH